MSEKSHFTAIYKKYWQKQIVSVKTGKTFFSTPCYNDQTPFRVKIRSKYEVTEMKAVKSHVICGKDGWYGLLVEIDCRHIETFEDLTEDRSRLEQFSQRINEGDLQPVHIYDVLEDFLG